jgi:hypothetical protein
MQNRLLRFAAILLLGSLPAIAHADILDFTAEIISMALPIMLCALIGLFILLYLLFRRPTPHNPPPPPSKLWPPKK